MTRPPSQALDVDPLLPEIRRRLPGVQGIWLFGSLALGRATAASDIDLAVLGATAFDPVAVFTLGLDLGVLAGRDVDLLDLRAVSTVMRKEVVCTGRLVSRDDADACANFVAASLALYVALREEQKLLGLSGGRRG